MDEAQKARAGSRSPLPAGFEEFVCEVAAGGGVLGPEALTEAAARYEIEILGPPGTLPAAERYSGMRASSAVCRASRTGSSSMRSKISW